MTDEQIKRGQLFISVARAFMLGGAQKSMHYARQKLERAGLKEYELAAFKKLIDENQAVMVGVDAAIAELADIGDQAAKLYVRGRAMFEEVVQVSLAAGLDDEDQETPA